jgi:hypothetical protein
LAKRLQSQVRTRRNKQSLIIVNAAKYSQGEIDLVWVLVGEGEDLPALKRAVEDPIRSEISERSSAL